MQCLYCGTRLAPLRTLANGQFCCDDHRVLYETCPAPVRCDDLFQYQRPAPQAGSMPALRFKAHNLAPKAPSLRKPSRDVGVAERCLKMAGKVELRLRGPGVRSYAREPLRTVAAAIAFSHKPSIPRLQAAPSKTMAQVELASGGPVDENAPPNVRAPLRLWRQAVELWGAAPGDLKLIVAALPLLLLLIVNAASHVRQKIPRIAAKAPSEQVVDSFVSRQMRLIRDSIADRAGFDYADDFRSGLDAWETKAGTPPNWSYDATGFIHPGVVALYRPSLQLCDYRFEFLSRLERRAVGAVFRARDTNNYYGLKLVLDRPGPLPQLNLVHFAMINGKELSRVEKKVPGLVFTNAFLHVRLEVRGSGFTLMVNDKVADFWTDDRLKTGGIGFFCGRGEEARLRWVNVSHQYDTLGRVCAYLAPSSFRKNGS